MRTAEKAFVILTLMLLVCLNFACMGDAAESPLVFFALLAATLVELWAMAIVGFEKYDNARR